MSVNRHIGERFWEKFELRGDEECWEWPGGKSWGGYGETSAFGSRHYKTHRLAYELQVGSIPRGLCVLHRCDNRPCCNPQHLFLGTRTDNAADRGAKGRTTKGADLPQAKLTSKDVQELRFARSLGTMYKDLASLFGITPSTARTIALREGWKHVP